MGVEMTMRLSVIISFLFHALIVLAFQKAFPWAPPIEELRTYQVELIRPPVEDLEKLGLSETDLAEIKEEASSPAEEEQDTISLDTKDTRYVTYARLIKERILREWRYPPLAKENLIEGRLLVVFSLSKSGAVVRNEIVNPSGFPILDREALRAVSAAAPFPPFPDHITVTKLNVRADFDYRIAARR